MLATVEDLNAPGLSTALQTYGVKAPDMGSGLSAPCAFDFMFECRSLNPVSLNLCTLDTGHRRYNACWPLLRNWMHR